ncbi:MULTISPECIES: 3'-5' exonuclease [unclassified Oceanispirochaeta]|uniref:3'-5' exonuclease n=1 Tax=unclassified Oceanispirochaeta TaxID=2635722 RepID=UPI000E099373|nr:MULTISPECIES: 3'-5' exonuclease [unclassified Oceanispirochaeta]MBF9015834.1 ATP-binding domain-containing protein [Oceanispirochaeta sp. M2]NPD72297.1 ATP-binding domain-containing protein [Oceanispirochaeta sp. M1]RDG32071.1 hypothetical protein DV872_09320 [Oceanispirochaeta sp. M1]
MGTGKVRISTLHSSKGLDMPVVLLFLPHLILPQQNLDAEASHQLKKNLLYVSMTRTMDLLNVFRKDEIDEPILQEIKKAFEA